MKGWPHAITPITSSRDRMKAFNAFVKKIHVNFFPLSDPLYAKVQEKTIKEFYHSKRR